MAGHSKWANIQHRKGAQDKRKAKVFTKLLRAISVAARAGDPNPDYNPALRLAIDKAWAENMPKDNIERAIKKASGGEDGVQMEALRYEGYGPGGVAVMVDCMTDNRTRTVGEVRHAFSKHGGQLGTDGSVAYLFTKQGLLSFPKGTNEDTLMEAALEAGAEDVLTQDDGSFEVITMPEAFASVKTALEARKLMPETADIIMNAAVKIALDLDNADKFLKLIERLEDLDDVQEVYSNADISEEILGQLA